ncbi:uncharacterized protein LOC135089945 [Scylla paramamosain]|uniref:uncharacterized protein LOC135089945 n=1 Tax=Scylla paramamosain TaxID=85552 RepID=UPI003082FFC1
MLIKEPWLIMRWKNVLWQPLIADEHPIMKHTRLMAYLLSGNSCENMAYLQQRGGGYDSVNTERGALPSLGIVVVWTAAEWDTTLLSTGLLRGVFNLRPSKPRYTETWNVKLVLQKLRTME